MKNLISSKDNTIEPNGAIGTQKYGLIFWQETDFGHHFSKIRFKSIISLIKKKFSPTSIQTFANVSFIQFNNDKNKTIFLSLKKERNSKHFFIYGESHTVYADAEFHLFVLDVVTYISKNIGSKFFVDDATGYLEHRSKEQLENYIDDFDITPVESEDLFRKAIIEHQNRPLDINEILSRDNEDNVVVDAYEYFMKKSKWVIDDRFNNIVQNFLYCASYDGCIGSGGISVFLIDNGGLIANKTADALHNIGAFESEKLLRESIELFPNSVVPEDKSKRSRLLKKFKEALTQLDIAAFNTDIDSFCYRYLINNKDSFFVE